MFIKRDNFTIGLKKPDEKAISSLNFKKIYSEIHQFFNSDKVIDIRILFVYSIEEFQFFTGRKHEKWMCASAEFPNLIIIFAPSVIEKFTIHKKQDIPNLVKHELSHLLYENAGFSKLPLFDEGIATYLSNYDKYKQNNEKVSIGSLVSCPDEKDNYFNGFSLVDRIIEKKGQKKLFKFLKKSVNTIDETLLNRMFEEIIGLSIEALLA